MLKKSAVAGGVALWAIPAVEVVGTRIAAAASGPQLLANCSVVVPRITTFVPGSGNKTTITISYYIDTAPTNILTETVEVDTSSTVSSSSSTFTFTLSHDGSVLSAYIPSSETVTIVSVVVNDANYGSVTGSYSNCNPFEIVAG
jgi:hypothetical protein